ncbi:hypothetical protein F8568_001750 [Actinomadura sp. LD22]|uniref:Uncharacterized protein n=1 Tax=Actinomadura physcomitrii TaxID=2650748 RepID=A0A6I4M5S6_9ACTN|nr:hypothetical protein [Actinomadura physcomitrii]MVZ99130.1 hypothetical protein [Actinomadura physcomitrii]
MPICPRSWPCWRTRRRSSIRRRSWWDKTWASRARSSYRLLQVTPSMDAHGLHFCEDTLRSVLDVLHRRLDLPDDARPRLAGDMLVAAWRHALGGWAAEAADPPSAAGLAARVRDAMAALPGSLTLPATPRAEAGGR